MLIKVYRASSEGEARYSPAEAIHTIDERLQQEMGELLCCRDALVLMV